MILGSLIVQNVKKVLGKLNLILLLLAQYAGFVSPCQKNLNQFSAPTPSKPQKSTSFMRHEFRIGDSLPDESCRKCGGLLLEFSICGICREPTQLICRICAKKTSQKYHDGYCFQVVPSQSECLIALS